MLQGAPASTKAVVNEESGEQIEKFMWTAKLLILALCFNIVIIKLSSCANPLNLQLIMSLDSKLVCLLIETPGF